ncbi:Hypothetical predicted protein [Octopus vulgaris]|uniref:Uncharacterized protein n=1 Tax=Octopus vulgaris TaxID=6645 RepID=A0AA36AQW0_OCTVU|nr:Hypothetical predicted protein [Octopus vulgaris]
MFDNLMIMGRKCDLTTSEKSVNTSNLAKNKSNLEISEITGRYQQTVKTFVTAPTKIRKRAEKVTSKPKQLELSGV